MKRLRISRKQILRAIRLACLALFLAACAGRASAAPSVGPGFSLSGSNVTGSGTDSGTYFLDSGMNGYVFTIQSGANLNNTGGPDANLIQFDHGSLTNSGSLSGYQGSTSDAIYIGRTTASGDGSTLTDSVTNHAGGFIGGSQSGVYVWNDITGGTSVNSNLSAFNAGTIKANAATSLYGALGLYDYNENTTGNLTNNLSLNNTSTGSISGYTDGVEMYNKSQYLTGNVSNHLTFANAGSIQSLSTTTGSGVYLYNENDYLNGNSSESLTISNTGSIYGRFNYGLNAYNYDNDDNYANAQSINDAISLTNSGRITAFGRYGVALGNENYYDYYAAQINETIQATNSASGYIFGTSSGIYLYSLNENSDGTDATNPVISSTLIFNNAGTVKSNGTASYLYTQNDLSGPSTASSDYGIGTQNSTSTITNSGTLQGGNYGLYAYNYSYYSQSGTINNSIALNNAGQITGTADDGAYLSNEDYYNYYDLTEANKIAVTNSGTITGNNGLYANNSSNSSNYYGIDGGKNTITDSISLNNSGTIIGTGGSGAFLENYFSGTYGTASATIAVTNSGTIQGTSSGLYIDNNLTGNQSSTVYNTGQITATSGVGVNFQFANATLTTAGGGISGTTDSVYLRQGNSTINILGRSNIVGTMEGNGQGNNTLNFKLVGATPTQAANFKAYVAGHTASGSYTIDGQNYTWDGFGSGAVNASVISLEQGVDPGLEQIATRIDTLGLPSYSGPGSAGAQFDAFYVAAATNPEAALNSLVGREFDGAFSSIALNGATSFAELVDGHSFNTSGGIDTTGLNVTSSSMIASLGQTDSLLSKLMGPSLVGGTTMSDSKDDITPTAPDKRWGAWASGTVTLADESNTASLPGYNAATESPTLGVDYRLARDLTVGGLFNYATTGAYFSDGSRLSADNELLGGYASWSHGPWYVNGLVGGGLAQYNNRRVAPDGSTAQSAPSGSEILANLTGGYEFKVGDGWRVSPEAGLQYTRLEEDAYNESDAGALDLNIGEQDVDSLRTKLGFRATDDFRWDGIHFMPQFHAAWYHECLDDSRGVTTSLAGAPALGSFIVSTTAPERDFALVGAGISATPSELHDNITFFVNYDAQVGQADYVAHTVDGGLKVDF